MDTNDARNLARAFRTTAENPAAIPSNSSPAMRQWKEGFCDGLKFAAAVLDLAADGKLVSDAEGELLAALMKPFDRAAGS